jgi:hypothetical protein
MAEKELIVFDQGLPRAKGWAGLDEATKERIQGITSDVKKFGAMEDFGRIGSGLRLMDADSELVGKSLTITTYIETIYKSSPSSGWRRLRQARKLAKKWPPDLIQAIAQKGPLLLQGVAGIEMGDLIRVADELPAPKKRDEKTIEGFIQNDVREKLREHKVSRRAGKSIKLDNEDGQRIIFNSTRRVMRAMKGLNTSAEKRDILRTVIGWLMEDFAISGTLECKRLSIPEGTVAKVGRPSKPGREKQA